MYTLPPAANTHRWFPISSGPCLQELCCPLRRPVADARYLQRWAVFDYLSRDALGHEPSADEADLNRPVHLLPEAFVQGKHYAGSRCGVRNGGKSTNTLATAALLRCLLWQRHCAPVSPICCVCTLVTCTHLQITRSKACMRRRVTVSQAIRRSAGRDESEIERHGLGRHLGRVGRVRESF